MNAVAVVRSAAPSALTFRRLAVASAVSLYVIVVSGATVRLTGSGLACESWPGCEPGSFFPEASHHSYVEFGNRFVSLFPIALTLAVWIGSRRLAALAPWVTWVAAVTFIGTIGQAPLGLLTIRSGLHPLMVATHFLLALAVLAGGVVVAVEARRVEDGPRPVLAAQRMRRFAVFVGAAALALVVTGTLATASGPHPGDKSEVHRLGNLYDAVQLHVRVTAIFGISLLLLVSYLFRRRRELRDVFGVSLVLLGVVLVQMGVGETQWRARLPWGLVLVHVSLAAAIWGLTVLLVYVLWRPARVWARDGTTLS